MEEMSGGIVFAGKLIVGWRILGSDKWTTLRLMTHQSIILPFDNVVQRHYLS